MLAVLSATCRGIPGARHPCGLSLHIARHGTLLRPGPAQKKAPLRVSGHKRKGHWDYASPTGCPYVEGLPPDFKVSKTHLDTHEVFGKTLLRRVAATTWSTKYGLAGKEHSQGRLVDLLWRGWQNFHVRALSHGQYISVVVARKVSESVFASPILGQLTSTLNLLPADLWLSQRLRA